MTAKRTRPSKSNGGAGRDTLIGGAADDGFPDSAGNDAMRGGAGADIFEFFVSKYRPVHGRDRILDFEEKRMISISLSMR